MIGIQVGAVSFVDEGVEKVLDEFQNDAAIKPCSSPLLLTGAGIAGRQVPGQPLPDHGKQTYDTDTFHGGCYTEVDPKYFHEYTVQELSRARFGELRRAGEADSPAHASAA